eukprot:Phypoly_transcript_10862.p1 GENE.Phypoly_transcript_10862~~Phypoly_transcript_10862.p1  ORF type:complete len:404 (-),score=77.67 Phypoly_transcript_10862:23-1234(-)
MRRRISSLAVNKFTNTKPSFTQPVEICSFGLTEDGKRVPGMLKKLTIPKLPFDCDAGFDAHVEKDPAKTSSLTPVLECLQENNIDIKGSIVTFRNNLNKILSTPYNNDEWQVDVKREKGTIFLDIVHLNQGPPNPQQAKAMYWGHHFESACADSTGASNEFCSVIKTKLNKNSIIFGAEIDCYDPDYTEPNKRNKPEPQPSPPSSPTSKKKKATSPTTSTPSSSVSATISSATSSTTSSTTSPTTTSTSTHPFPTLDTTSPPENTSSSQSGVKRSHDDVAPTEPRAPIQPAYVEIKTNRILSHPNMERSFKRYKLMHCWIQSFLAGVPTILFGFRDDVGVVQELLRYKTLDIPKLVDKLWDPYVCLNFADEIMTMLWQKTEEGKRYSLVCKPPCRYVDLEEIL